MNAKMMACKAIHLFPSDLGEEPKSKI